MKLESVVSKLLLFADDTSLMVGPAEQLIYKSLFGYARKCGKNEVMVVCLEGVKPQREVQMNCDIMEAVSTSNPQGSCSSD